MLYTLKKLPKSKYPPLTLGRGIWIGRDTTSGLLLCPLPRAAYQQIHQNGPSQCLNPLRGTRKEENTVFRTHSWDVTGQLM